MTRSAGWLAIVAGLALTTGCLKKQLQQPQVNDRATTPLPSPLAKAQPPEAPQPIKAVGLVANPSEDPTEFRAVAPRVPEPPAPAEIQLASVDDEKKRLLERLKERREERKEEREKKPATPEPMKLLEEPKLPSPFAPKPNSPAPAKPADPAAPVPTPTTPVSSDLIAAKKLLETAKTRYDLVSDYQIQMVRRETLQGKEQPTEEVLLQFRKPLAVYMRNIGDVGRGREVLYVEGKFNGLMYVVTGEGDNRLMGAGFKTSLKPDSPLATAKSRRRITDAGNGNTLARLGRLLESAEKSGRANAVKVLTNVTRKETPSPLDAVQVTLTPSDDPNLPKGGLLTIFFDTQPSSASYGWPVVITTHEGEREVEYYAMSQLKAPAGLTDADFTPERLQKKK